MTVLPARNFAALMSDLEDGRLLSELTDAYQDLVADMENTAQAQGGKQTAKITITLDFLRDGGVFEVKADYAVKKPRLKRLRSLFWGTADNFLSRSNPRQLDMPFRDVTGDRSDVRDAG